MLERAFASRLCSALSFLSSLGISAMTRLQDEIVPAITAGIPKEAKINRTGFAEWVDSILDQRAGYKLAHNWTRGTPKAPPLPASGTYGG
eukprot:8840635-Karenia_brevis.AAC.1